MHKTDLVLGIIFVFAMAAPCGHAQSLYKESSYRGLATDSKAARIGDSITVLVTETAAAESSIGNNSNENSANSVSGSNQTNTESLTTSANSDYKLGGKVTRKGKLLAKLTVTVHEVLPSGELVIKGEQTIQVNNEKQLISISGNIRSVDIDADNTVLSSKISNAQLSYSGEGFIGSDKPGVITEFFRWLF